MVNQDLVRQKTTVQSLYATDSNSGPAMTSLIKTKPQSIQSRPHFQFFGPSSLLKDAEHALLSLESVCISLLEITQMMQQSNICTHDKNPKHQQPLRCWHTRNYSTHQVKPSLLAHQKLQHTPGQTFVVGTPETTAHTRSNLRCWHTRNYSTHQVKPSLLAHQKLQHTPGQTFVVGTPETTAHTRSNLQDNAAAQVGGELKTATCAICLPNMCNLSPPKTCAICLPNMCNLSPKKHVQSVSQTCAICLPNMCNMSPRHVQSVPQKTCGLTP